MGAVTIAPSRPTAADLEQLRFLAKLWFVYSCLAGLVCLVGLAMVVGGLVAETFRTTVLAAQAGPFFALFGGAVAALRVLTGLALLHHRHRVLCLVVSVFSLLAIPLGSLLGIVTLLVLRRPWAEALFAGRRRCRGS